MATSPSLHQAIVFGASGISGWAITRAALLATDSFAFKKVIGLTSRPLKAQDSFLPDDSRLELRSGLDLTKGVDAVTEFLGQISGIEQTTHIYFTGSMVQF